MSVTLGAPATCARCLEPYTFQGAYRLRDPLPDDHPLPAHLRFESEDGRYLMCPKCAREGARWFVKSKRKDG